MQRRAPQRRRQPADRGGDRSRALRRRRRRRREAYLTTLRAGGDGQELSLVQPLSDDRRLRDLRRPRVPDVHPRQPAQRQPEARAVLQGRRPADQLRGARARGLGPRRDDRQSRQAHLGDRARQRSEGGDLKVDDSDTPPFIDAEDQRARQGAERRAHLHSPATRPSRR